jgi:hypothetical protein
LFHLLAVLCCPFAYAQRRYQQDVITNSTLVSVWRFDAWTDVSWANVRAGDIVRVLCDNYFPADLVLLQSSSNQGACSIETANLDGETNLKVKQAVPQTYELACGPDGLDYPQVFSAVLESDPPNDKMDANSWNGNLHALQTSAGQVAPTVPLGFSQLLLRGCRLVNTRWVVALVCFTGRETKLMLQAKSKEVKRSQIDRAVDKCLYLIFLFQAAACAVGAAGQFRWLDDGGKNLAYLRWGTDLDVGVFAFLSYFSYLVLMDICQHLHRQKHGAGRNARRNTTGQGDPRLPHLTHSFSVPTRVCACRSGSHLPVRVDGAGEVRPGLLHQRRLGHATPQRHGVRRRGRHPRAGTHLKPQRGAWTDRLHLLG